jgi:hypothetical protein
MNIKEISLGDYSIEMDKLELAKGLRDELKNLIDTYGEELKDTKYMKNLKKLYSELKIQIASEEPEVV